MKITSKIKPQTDEENYSNEIYYKRLKDIPGYSVAALGVTFFYLKIEDYLGSGLPVYFRCSKEDYIKMRNLNRNFERREYSYNEHVGNFCISMNATYKNKEGVEIIIEYADNSVDSPMDYVEKEALKEALAVALDKLTPTEVIIFQEKLKGKSDQEISKVVNLSRSRVQELRTKVFDMLRTELEEFR